MQVDRNRFVLAVYRGTSLMRKRHPLGPYSRPTPRALRWFVYIPLYTTSVTTW